MLEFALFIDRIAEFIVPVMSYFLSFDITQMRLVTEPSQLGELPFSITVSLFLFLSALTHFIIVSPWSNKIYNCDLEKEMNRFRWYEYALSSSLIIVLIAMLFGVYDIGAIILVAVVNASMNFFGLDMEEINYYTKN